MALLFRYLDTVGDGSGTKDSAVNHSAALEEYKIVTCGSVSIDGFSAAHELHE